MTILQFIYIDLKCLLCVCVTVYNKYNLTIELQALHHTRPSLGRYAGSRIWAPLFRNSGSAPVITLTLHDLCHVDCN